MTENSSGLESDDVVKLVKDAVRKQQQEKQQPRRWKESASLILIARNDYELGFKAIDGKLSIQFDYKVLVAKRSSRTAFVQNHCVFPGGHFDAADEAVAWLEYFEEFGVSETSLRKLIIVSAADDEPRPRILAPQGNGCYDRFFKQSKIWAREISMRLTALRETFEEVGVLLCRSKEQLNATSEGGCAHYINEFEKQRWQEAVHKDAREFLQLCRTLHVVPDLWALYEWSAWASPALVKKATEVVFFIAFVPRQLDVLPEPLEINECLWQSPAQVLQDYRFDKVYLLPPQVYELSRFLGIAKFVALLKFARERGSKGVTLNMPVLYGCHDGVVSVLPGDDHYLDDPRSVESVISIPCTKAVFKARAKRIHRCDDSGTPNYQLHINFKLPNGHLPPVNGFALLQTRAKL